MKIIDEKHSIWTEKYRPQCINDVIMPESYRKKFKEWIQKGEIPHIGIWGNTPGTGKSTIAGALIKELNTETKKINGSKDNGIDEMRYGIGSFASSMAITGKKKIVFIDESDYLTTNAQSSLRTDLETYAKNTSFIFTGNYPDRIITPLMDRFQNFNLDDIYANNKKELAQQIFQRLIFILENEHIDYNKKDVLEIVKKFYPSTRSMIMFMQQNTVNGVLNFDHIHTMDDVFEEMILSMKKRKFNEIKKIVDEILVPDNAYTYLWKHIDDIFKIEGQPQVIMLLADYQDYSQRATNKHIPLMAMITKIIGDNSVKFK